MDYFLLYIDRRRFDQSEMTGYHKDGWMQDGIFAIEHIRDWFLRVYGEAAIHRVKGSIHDESPCFA
jgi:hypothetical protein